MILSEEPTALEVEGKTGSVCIRLEGPDSVDAELRLPSRDVADDFVEPPGCLNTADLSAEETFVLEDEDCPYPVDRTNSSACALVGNFLYTAPGSPLIAASHSVQVVKTPVCRPFCTA